MAKKPIEHWLMITASQLRVIASPDHRVAMHFHFPNDEIGLAEGVGLAVAFRPHEARQIARQLQEQADYAEGKSSGSGAS